MKRHIQDTWDSNGCQFKYTSCKVITIQCDEIPVIETTLG